MYENLHIKSLFSLSGKIALVTGGSGNLGPWWILSLLANGARVISIDLRGMPVPDVLTPITKIYPGSYKSFEGDVTDPESLSNIHKEIIKEMGRIEILVNNAGIDVSPKRKSPGSKNNQTDTVSNTKIWNVNVQGCVNCIEEFSKDMIYKKSGSIINISSLYSEKSPDEKLYNHMDFDKPWVYGSTKAAVNQITRHYATRLAKFYIRVNSLSPGGISNNQDSEFVKKFISRVPLGRMGDKKKDLAGPLIFLASKASEYVTGINLQVNGGYTAW
jgi:NAD(P)-dependent dehydrogenase (short-subunit alcohol dehydrogenase family)